MSIGSLLFALLGVFTNKQLMIHLLFFLWLIAGKKTPVMAKLQIYIKF